MDTLAVALSQGAKELGVSLEQTHIAQFEAYCSMLLAWNKRMNLTAILEPKEIAVKHFLDSLALFREHQFTSGACVIDVGTGAGFPGIPLKIVRPDLKLVLLDSLQKRTHFLQAIVEQLSLSNVTVVHGRAEEMGRDAKYRESFDIALSRAVAPLNILVEFCLPFVRIGGYFLSLKGPEVQEEIMQAQIAISALGGSLKRTSSFSLPVSGDPRSLVLIEKIKDTPEKYPRRPGIPEKKPLK
jgi:16S rRNA (guanine527-N7)-methyltransferase